MMQLIHIKEYDIKDIEEKININEDMDYKVKSLAISLINNINPEDYTLMTIDPEYNKIKINVNSGVYNVNTELGDSIEFESSDGNVIKKFKLVN